MILLDIQKFVKIMTYSGVAQSRNSSLTNQNGGGGGQGSEKVIIVPPECERGGLQEGKTLKQDHIIVMFIGVNSRKETAEPGVVWRAHW